MLSFCHKYAHNIHSQNGEDGIIAECLKRMNLSTGHAVEAGGNDGLWLSNTRHLLDQGWSGLFVEADYNLHLQSKRNWANNPKVRHQCSKVDGRNINAFVDETCDLLSLDTDGHDYAIFEGLQAKPKIVIVEIDSSIPPDRRQFNSEGGAGYLPMLLLGYVKGYFLLAHTGNMVFVRNEFEFLFPELKGTSALSDHDQYFNRTWLKQEAA